MSHVVSKIFRHVRRRFIDAPRGLGHRVEAAAFDREYLSGHWDLLFSSAELPRNEALLEFCLGLAPQPSVLDIGCGSGRLAQLLVPHLPQRYVGLDLSLEGLRRARALNLPGCKFIAGDFETWRPAAGETFDAIVFNESIGYARDPRDTLRAFSPFVRPGGAILVSYFRSGNYRAIWTRLSSHFIPVRETLVTADSDHAWDVRALRSLSVAPTA